MQRFVKRVSLLASVALLLTGCASDDSEPDRSTVEVKWKVARLVGDDTIVVPVVDYWKCKYSLTEDADQVEITIRCPKSSYEAGSGLDVVYVDLSKHLGDRDVVDGSTGKRALLCQPPLSSIDVGVPKCVPPRPSRAV